jgi:hypothetical protein
LKVKDLTDEYFGEFRDKAAYALELIAKLKARIASARVNIQQERDRIDIQRSSIEHIEDTEVEDITVPEGWGG